MYGGHLISDRANPADPGCNVGGFEKMAAAQQRFEQAWWLENLQLDILYFVRFQLNEQRRLALHARHIVDLDGLVLFAGFQGRAHLCSFRSMAWRYGHAQALKERKARITSSSLRPLSRRWAANAVPFVVSMGPKQP